MRWSQLGLACVNVILLSSGPAGCADLQPRPDLPTDSAIPAGEGGPLDRGIAAAEAQHPAHSAFRLVTEGTEAFVTRMQSAQMAVRSLDVQTYIWHADDTGLFLAQQLLASADRGVRVRLLLDDLDARAKNAGLAALAAHPGIEVRMFNPFASRKGTLRKIGEGIRDFGRINHRMHNKTWIADNRIAIAGGRNTGDEYFGASDEVNFVDLDFAMIGPVVRDASASFDRYWNSPSAYPMETLDSASVSIAALEKLRTALAAHERQAANSRYAVALRVDEAVKNLVSGHWRMEWADKYQFVADDPRKIEMAKDDANRTNVGAALVPMITSAQQSVFIISPYFVPGDAVTAKLAETARSGRSVRVLTNSLLANDVAAVHGGYSRYRKPLLEGAVQLWELKPLVGAAADSSLFGSSGASLHTKSFGVDGRTLFVGSYNLDPRSTWLNCEQGVLVENAVLAGQLEEIFNRQTVAQRAWRVSLVDQELHWSDGQESFNSDPKAPLGRRFQAWLVRVLHLEAQL